MSDKHAASAVFSVAYYSGDRKTGALAVVSREGGRTSIDPLTAAPASGLEPALKPVLAGLTRDDHRAIVLDPRGKTLHFTRSLPVDVFAAHVYSDPYSNRDWFMNDGDKETGNDTLNCGDKGSSVAVVEDTASGAARFLKTICVGRGHHQACFTAPSSAHPAAPRRAYISNLKDGTISVIGNEPQDAASYLQVLATIDLCEPEREEGGRAGVPNNAFPHGLAYSPLSGRLYNLNNGYGTVAVIDPLTNTIERRFGFKGHSNLFTVPGGRYLIGRGADRKSDPQHVIAKLSALDVSGETVTSRLDLPDIYFSKYYFNPEGTKLYLTTSSSGSPEQAASIKSDALLVLDMTALPHLVVKKEIRLGTPSGSLAFVQQGGRTRWVLSSHSEEGALALIDADTDELVEKIRVGEHAPHSRIWLL